MKMTAWLQETRKMRFEEAYGMGRACVYHRKRRRGGWASVGGPFGGLWTGTKTMVWTV